MYNLRSSTRRGGASQPVDSRNPPARDSATSTRSTRSTRLITTKASTTTPPSKQRGKTKREQTIHANQSPPPLPATIPQPPTTISDLPAELKHLIASFLNVFDTQALVRVNQQWRSAAETCNWRHISASKLISWYTTEESDEEVWTNLAATIVSRPDLAIRVDRFHYTLKPNLRLRTSMMTVLRALAPSLREMVLECRCRLGRQDPDLRVGSVMLGDVRVIPNLVRLAVSLSYTDAFEELVCILRHSPSLQYLDVRFEGCTVEQSVQHAELILPRLEELKVDADEPEPIAAALLPISPRLKHLKLACDLLDPECVHDVDDPDLEAEEFTSEILTILRHKGLSSLDLGAKSSSAILDFIRANEDGGLLENVRTLSIWAPLCSTKPRLPNLEVLCIVTWGYPILHFFAEIPTIRCTGLLANWVIDLIDDQIKLTCLIISEARGIWWIENAGSKGFHCRVYTNPNAPNNLYHVRARAKDIPSGLLATQSEHMYSRDPRLPVSAPEIDFDDSGAAEDGWFDFTWFLGRPIPMDMLEDIARDAGHERLWTTGRSNDLTLSDGMWRDLECWRFDMLVRQYTNAPR